MPKSLPIVDASGALCCAPLGSGALSVDEALGVAQRFKAVADPVRVRLLSLLAGAPDSGCCTCDLAPAVGVGEATVSHHLKKLLEAGLVTKRRDGMNVYYRAVPEALDALAAVLSTTPRPAATSD